MMRNGIVFALLVVTLAAASDHIDSGGVGYYAGSSGRTADTDFLLKQKKIYDLLGYVGQNVLTDTEHFEIAHSYDLANSIENYTNKEIFSEFLSYYKSGSYLSRDALFSFYNKEHRYEMVLLYRLFYFAKDFTTFYKTACWARLHMSTAMFVTAFTNAVAYRSDTNNFRLPVIYEIYPSMFFDSKVIHDAYQLKMTHGSHYRSHSMNLKRGEGMDSTETYYIYANYSEYSHNLEHNYDYKLNYFMEDIGLNSYYYYFRMTYPFWMDLKDYDLPKNFRGEFYYYMHKQIMSRYYLERMSHGLNELSYFSWDRVDMPGYYSDLSFANGVSMPRRDWWTVVPFYKNQYVENIKKLESRIFEAIDSGYFQDEMGKQISLYTNEGLNYLGNLIEGNYDSYNLKYYGSYDALARNILGMSYEGSSKNHYIPSSFQFFSTSVRDPAFYRIYDKILYFFQKYKNYLARYSKNELEFQGVRIENVDVDKLETYFDAKDYYINNAVSVDSYKEGKSFSIKAWRYYLNYKPYSYKFAVNSDKVTKGLMHIFLGPDYEGEQYGDYYSYFSKYYKYFFELDQFVIDLKPGMNNFERNSTDSPLFSNYKHLDSDVYYKKIVKAIESNETFTYSGSSYAFPSNLMLPKGSVKGMKYKMFFFVHPYEEGKINNEPYFGEFKSHGHSFGFPLDRPVYPWFFKLNNVYFKDVSIYHMKDYDSKYYNRGY